MNGPTPFTENRRKPSVWFSIFVVTLFTVFAYSNAVHDEMVFDDKGFAGSDRMAKLESMPDAFMRDVWGDIRPGQGFYRPLMLISLDLQNRAFGDWFTGYHVVNIAQHLVATLLLLGFLRYLLRLRGIEGKQAELAALVAAILFGIHPIGTEVVNSIFNGSSISVAIFAIAGLWWLLSQLESRPLAAWLGFGLAYCTAILFKESALSLPGIAVALIFLMTEGSFWQRVRRFLPVFVMFLPIALYFYLRFQALGVGADIPEEELQAMSRSSLLPDADTFRYIGILLVQALGGLAWPWPLKLFYLPPSQLMLILGTVSWVILLIAAVVLYFRNSPSLAAGISFFLIASLPASRLIGMDGLNPHYADRYFYYPSIGLSIVLAFAAFAVAKRFGWKIIALLALPLILLGTGATLSRNQDWSSNMSLFKSEIRHDQDHLAAIRLVMGSLWQTGQYDAIVQICDSNPQFNAQHPLFANACSNVYIQIGRREDAILALQASMEFEEGWMNRNLLLGNLLIQTGRRQEGADRYAHVINRLEDRSLQEFYKGLLYLQLYPTDHEYLKKAQKHMLLAQGLDPGLQAAQPYLERIDSILNPREGDAAESDDPPAWTDMVLPMPKKKD